MRTPWASETDAVADVLGTILLVSVTVATAAGLAMLVSGIDPPIDDRPSVLSVELDPGNSGWGTGDEVISVMHRGGKALEDHQVSLQLRIGSVSTTVAPASGAPFEDGVFVAGESWNITQTIPGETEVRVLAIHAGSAPFVIAMGSFVTDSGIDCTGDTQGPTVTTYLSAPTDVDQGTTGAVTITAILADDCSGVQTSPAPMLHHRINDGSDPPWTQESMVLVTGTTFRATVPEPPGGWSSFGGSQFETQIKGMSDYLGNLADDAVRQDAIQPASVYTYVTCPSVVSPGTISNCPYLQDDTDSLSARLLEGAILGTVTSNRYGSYAIGGGGTLVAYLAHSAPDDQYAVVPEHIDQVRVGGFGSTSGTIVAVEIGFEGRYTGLYLDDQVRLAYRLGGSLQANYRDFQPQITDTVAMHNVTLDRSWTWSDILGMEVDAQFRRVGTEDAVDMLVDSLWIRVSTDTTTYRLDANFQWPSLPPGTQTVQMGYQAFTDPIRVEVWDAVNAQWNPRGPMLNPGPPATFTYPLTADELNGGTPRIRFMDQNTAPGAPGDVFVDYLRIRTS